MARNITRLTAAIGAAAAAISLSACASADPSETESTSDASRGAVAMGFAGSDITIWNDQLEIMRPLIEAAGYEFLTDDPQWDINQQVSNWQAWINRGDVKAIMGYPVQADAMIPVTESANAAGIPVFGYLLSWEGASASMLVDSYQGGYDLAVNAAETIIDEGNEDSTFVIVGDRGTDFTADATQGLVDGLASVLPDAKVVELSGSVEQDGYDVAKAQLTSDPDSTIWLGYSNDVIHGVYHALLDSGVAEDDPDYYLASRDATNQTLDFIKIPNSIYRTSIIVPAQALAEANAELLIAGAEGEDTEDIIVPSVFVTSDNADDYYVTE